MGWIFSYFAFGLLIFRQSTFNKILMKSLCPKPTKLPKKAFWTKTFEQKNKIESSKICQN